MNNLKKLGLLTITFLIIFSNHVNAVKVVIDPGHGGKDPGAIGVNGLYEKTVNLDVSLKLQHELLQRGYDAVLTRTVDQSLTLQERVDFKENENADLFVSVHANAHHSANIKGSLILYYDDRFPNKNYPASPEMKVLSSQNRQFAQFVLTHLTEQIHTQNRGLVPNSSYIIRHGTMPSILVELAFLSNWEDIVTLSSEEKRSKMALGIAKGIEQFRPLVGFRDVQGHWAYESIQRLSKKGIVKGSNLEYEPNRALTRAEFLILMDRIFKFSIEEEPEDQWVEPQLQKSTEESELQVQAIPYPSFKDIEIKHWAYSVMEKAHTKGYIKGYPDGTLRPNQAITRAEVSVLFNRIWRQNEETLLDPLNIIPFDDVPLSIWFANAVYYLKSNTIIQGMSSTLFIPDRFMSRAEIAAMLDRYLIQFESSLSSLK